MYGDRQGRNKNCQRNKSENEVGHSQTSEIPLHDKRQSMVLTISIMKR